MIRRKRQIVAAALFGFLLACLTFMFVDASVSDASLASSPNLNPPKWDIARMRSSADAGNVAEHVSIGEPLANKPHREGLPERLHPVYDKMEQAFRAMSESCLIPYCNYIELDKVFISVLYDNPDIFWVDNYISLPSPANAFMFFPLYNEWPRERVQERYSAYMNDVNELAAEIMDEARMEQEGTSESVLASAAMSTLCRRLSYGTARHDQTIRAFFGEDGQFAVCTCYAKSFSLLCSALGLECHAVWGTTSQEEDGSTHAWNILRLDGEFYYADATWGDCGWDAETGSLTGRGDMFSGDHHVTGPFQNTVFYRESEEEILEERRASAGISECQKTSESLDEACIPVVSAD